MRRLAYLWLFGLLLPSSALGQDTRFPVKHDHLLGSCKGELIFKEDGIEFIAAHGKHGRVWKYEEIQQLGLLGPAEVSILTYEDNKWEMGKDRLFRFAITKGEITPGLWQMLQAKVATPLVSAVLPPDVKSKYQIPVKHARGFSGSNGMLEISDQFIVYRTDAKGDSRIWRIEDISSIGTTGPYQLRLTSMDRVQGESGSERNFVFQLKRRLDPQIYDFIWWKINGPQISGISRKH
jgi:hypothetical protein